MRVFAAIFAIGSLPLAGCSIKPVPDTVTGLSTVAIVSQIRCESKQAILSLLEEQLTRLGDMKSLERLRAIRENPNNIVLLKDYSKLPTEQRIIFQRFQNTVVVLDFQLRMTENNTLSGASNLARPFTVGLDLIGLKVGDTLARQNYRTFRINTNLKEIFKDHCALEGSAPNYQYPIAGAIGLKETFGTYFSLANVNKLDQIKDWSENAPFVDTIKFTTTISGEIDPSFSLTPKGRGYVVRDASGILGASRVDEHQLTVGIYLPKGEKSFAGSAGAQAVLNNEVDRSQLKLQLFGLNPIDPFAQLNRP